MEHRAPAVEQGALPDSSVAQSVVHPPIRGTVQALRAAFTSPLFLRLFVAVVAVLYLVPRALVNLDVYDEGIRLYGGMRVLAGAQPYHDFFAYYGPAEFYWPAALFAVFGEQLVVSRIGGVFFVLVALWALAVLLHGAGVGRVGVCCAAGAVLLPFNTMPIFVLDPALALAFAAGALLLGGQGTGRLVGSGALIGFASTFRHDFGAYAALAVVALLAATGMDRRERRQSTLSLLRRTAVVAAAALGVALSVYGPVALSDPGRVWDSLVPRLAYLMEFRAIPYDHAFRRIWQGFSFLGARATDDLRLLVMLAPPLGVIGLLALVLPRLRRDVVAEPLRAAALVFLASLGLGLCVYAFGRSDHKHVYPLYCTVVGALAIVLGSAGRAAGVPRVSSMLERGLALVIAVVIGIGAGVSWMEWHDRHPAPWPRADGVRVGSDTRWLSEAIADVERHAGDEPIFVGSLRHDRVHHNLMLVYFLTGRPSATYYQDFLPGLTTSEDVQRRIISDIEASGASAALLWSDEPRDEPNRSATEHGSSLLDRYLARHFAVRTEERTYRVLTRKP